MPNSLRPSAKRHVRGTFEFSNYELRVEIETDEGRTPIQFITPWRLITVRGAFDCKEVLETLYRGLGVVLFSMGEEKARD
jgi:hypothetical protein